MNAPSTITVTSYATDEETTQDKVNRSLATTLERAEFDRAATDFLDQIRQNEAVLAYKVPIPSSELDLWESYFGRFTPKTLSDIPDEAIPLLERAVNLDCFNEIKMWRRNDHYVLYGTVGTGYKRRHFLIADWRPSTAPQLSLELLRTAHDAASAEAEERRKQQEQVQEERMQQYAERHRVAKRTTLIIMGVLVTLLIAINLMLFTVLYQAGVTGILVAAASTLVSAVAALVIYSDRDENSLRRTLRTVLFPSLIFTLALSAILAGSWAQLGIDTQSLTVCETYDREYSDFEQKNNYSEYPTKAATDKNQEYVLSEDASRVLKGYPSNVRVRADIQQHLLWGTPTIVKATVVPASEEATYIACQPPLG